VNAPQGAAGPDPEAWAGGASPWPRPWWARWLRLVRGVGLAVVELLGIFVADLVLPPAVALGAFYAVPLLFCFQVGRREVVCVAVASSVLAPLGALWGNFGPGALDVGVLVPATTGVFAVWLTARLVLIRVADEERMFAARELNEIALGATADAVVVADAEQRVTWINSAAERLLGWRRSEATGLPFARLVPREEISEDRRIEALGSQDSRLKVRLRNGARLDVDVTYGAIRDLAGRQRGGVWVMRDVSQRVALERELRELAFRDRLTGLPNRALLVERLDLELAHARRDGTQLAVLFIDLDRFKEINDSLGHQAGDDLLRGVGDRLAACLRKADTVARLAGDEFVILLPRVRDRHDAEVVAVKVREALAEPFVLAGARRPVTCSIGIALYPEHAGDQLTLLERADAAMYRSKAEGSGGHRFAAEPIDSGAPPRLTGR
jgi:diguanylate cyclase (GGDEF)-like protein/PAS domain S-box-containing protein